MLSVLIPITWLPFIFGALIIGTIARTVAARREQARVARRNDELARQAPSMHGERGQAGPGDW